MVQRRDVLRTGAAIVAGAAADPAVGEALPANGDRNAPRGRASVPSYADWIPAPSAGQGDALPRSVWHYEMEPTLAMRARSDASPPTDSMVLNPRGVGASTPLLWALVEAGGLGKPVLGPATDDSDVDPAAVPTDHGLSLGGTQIYLGSFDTGAIDSVVRGQKYEETAMDGVYVYRADGDELYVTYDGTAVVAGTNGSAVKTVYDAGTGRVDRRHEVDPDFAWLLEAGGRGDMTVAQLSSDGTVDLGVHGDLSDVSMFEGTDGFAQSVSLTDGTVATATTAVLYAGEERVALQKLKSELGVKATDRDVTKNGRKVTLTADYTGPDEVTADTPTPMTVPGMGLLAGLGGLAGLAAVRAMGGGDRDGRDP